MKLSVLFLLLLLCMPVALAAIDFNGNPSSSDVQQFDAILEPVMKIYNFVKYAATAIGVLMLVFAGIVYITAGGETTKKERGKYMATGVIIGLIIIWVAPLVVQYIFS